MSRQRKKHAASVRRSKRRRAVRRMAEQWRWDHAYWGPKVYAKVSEWLLDQVVAKLILGGVRVLKQGSIVPRLVKKE